MLDLEELKTFGTVAILGHPENTDGCVQGDRTLRTVRCRTCGMATHWEALVPDSDNRQGTNLNNFPPAQKRTGRQAMS